MFIWNWSLTVSVFLSATFGNPIPKDTRFFILFYFLLLNITSWDNLRAECNSRTYLWPNSSMLLYDISLYSCKTFMLGSLQREKKITHLIKFYIFQIISHTFHLKHIIILWDQPNYASVSKCLNVILKVEVTHSKSEDEHIFCPFNVLSLTSMNFLHAAWCLKKHYKHEC